MDKIYILLILAFLLFSLATYHYRPPALAYADQACHPNAKVCVICPLLSPFSSLINGDEHIYMEHSGEFKILVGREGVVLRKAFCQEFLEVINEDLSLAANQHLI